MEKRDEMQFWRHLDLVVDVLFVIRRDGSLLYANESFFNLCGVTRRVLRGSKDVRGILTLPKECWEPLEAKTFSWNGYREVDFEVEGTSGRVQIVVNCIDDAGDEPLYLYALHDVTIESRLHTKYRAQIGENEKLITHLKRTLRETELLKRISSEVPMHRDASAFVLNIAEILKTDLEFYDVEFFDLQPNGQALTPNDPARRMGSRLRSVSSFLRQKGLPGELQATGISTLTLPPYGTFWIAKVTPRLEAPRLLVLGLTPEMEGQDYRSFIGSFVAQTSTLLDNRALYIAATTDPLTSVFNRRYFDTRLGIECSRSRQGRMPLAVLLFDVDKFKNVNDTYGHPFGDQVLKVLGELIQTAVRDDDVAARLGGEEFAVILPDTNAADGRILADRIRERFAKTVMRVPETGEEVTVTVSCGVAETSFALSTPEALYKAADEALYRAKAEGRNRVLLAAA